MEIEGFGTILDLLAFVPDGWYTHDFDVHGSGSGNTIDFEDGLVPPHARGEAGKNFDIGGNTFLGDNRETWTCAVPPA